MIQFWQIIFQLGWNQQLDERCVFFFCEVFPWFFFSNLPQSFKSFWEDEAFDVLFTVLVKAMCIWNLDVFFTNMIP